MKDFHRSCLCRVIPQPFPNAPLQQLRETPALPRAVPLGVQGWCARGKNAGLQRGAAHVPQLLGGGIREIWEYDGHVAGCRWGNSLGTQLPALSRVTPRSDPWW